MQIIWNQGSSLKQLNFISFSAFIIRRVEATRPRRHWGDTTGVVLMQQQRPGEQDEAIKGGGEVAGAGAADLVGGCGGDSEDGGVRVDEEQLIDGEP